MAITRISGVRSLVGAGSEIEDFSLVEPAPGSSSNSYSVTIRGHVVSVERRPLALELRCDGQPPTSIPNRLPRPDLAAAYPDVPWARTHSGFRASVSVLPFPNTFSAELFVVMDDKRRHPLAVIEGEHDSPPVLPGDVPPIIVTTLGRTGSTWVLDLLAHHPNVIAYPAFKGEVRCATYWAEVMTALTNPASYFQGVRTRAVGPDWWMGKTRGFDIALEDDDLEDWLGRTQVEVMAQFYKERIDEFYRYLAVRLGCASPRYFAEKGLPTTRLALLRQLYPGLKEVFLVRDFRDMLASIFAYSRAKGVRSFGREKAESDEEYVRHYLGRDVNRLLTAWRDRHHEAYLLRYEDLVTAPDDTLRDFLGHLDLDQNDHAIDAMLRLAEGKRPKEELVHRTTKTPQDSLQRWQRDLDPELRAVSQEQFADALAAFGYE